MINVAIVGYGNLGKGVENAVINNSDMKLFGIFTRRDPSEIKTNFCKKVYKLEDIEKYKKKIDVVINCGGSATDLPKSSKMLLKDFNVVDSFDTHALINEHFLDLDKTGKKSKKLCAISIGWDPGIFSIARTLFKSALPNGNDYTFWGKGVSQGHSDAIRRIKGVVNAIQYTIPKEEALERVRKGENPVLSARDKHLRECFVAIEKEEDKERIEKEIKSMPNYFADYDTIVHFVDNSEVKKMQQKLSHGGFVIRSGKTNEETKHILELSLKLDSNPQFTGSVLVAFGRAVYKLNKEGKCGAVTCLDIPLSYLLNESAENIRKTLV